jgi:hypothetical protein
VFVLLVLAKVRAILMLRFSPDMKKELAEQFSEQDLNVLVELSGRDGAAINSTLLAELIAALLETNRAPLPSLPLELALYRVFAEEKQAALL